MRSGSRGAPTRELQRKAERLTSQRRDLLLARRSLHDHRGLALALQQSAASCIARISCAYSGGVRADASRGMAGSASRKRSAGHAAASVRADDELTIELDHSMGADQRELQNDAITLRLRSQRSEPLHRGEAIGVSTRASRSLMRSVTRCAWSEKPDAGQGGWVVIRLPPARPRCDSNQNA